MCRRGYKRIYNRCNRTGKVIFATELDAKIALSTRVWKDKGEVRHYPCGDHFHLSSMEQNGDIDSER